MKTEGNRSDRKYVKPFNNRESSRARLAFCARCGRELPADAQFCPKCGAPVRAEQRQETEFDRLTRDSRIQGHWVSRLVAYVIDILIVNFIVFLIAVVVLLPFGITVGLLFPFASFGFIGLLSSLALLLQGFVAILYLGYFTLTEATFQKTPGKALLGLRVVSTDGTPFDIRKAFIRNVSKVYWLLLLLDLLVGLVMPLREGQKYSDHLASTSVVSGTVGGGIRT